MIAGSVVFVLCSQAPNALSQKSIVTCPTSITCNYDAGTCQYPSGWEFSYGGAWQSFKGSLSIKLGGFDNISPISGGSIGNSYMLTCKYYYAAPKSASSFSLSTFVDELVGSGWTKTGFGKNQTECITDALNPDVTACAGSRGS